MHELAVPALGRRYERTFDFAMGPIAREWRYDGSPEQGGGADAAAIRGARGCGPDRQGTD